ncbi:MAG: hypothetical protein Q8O13_04210 [Candidatus Omnitrophota bacterium]|nr:hypothetical protein [Candidatus Omnitrophota bacterium]
MMRRIFLAIIISSLALVFNNLAFAEKLVILYTGETHASLYPCHCPIEPFGGVARRATKIKSLRQEFSNLLLIDSGGFFAGGFQDETNQSIDLQKARTQIYLKTLKIMGYDALAIGDDEFNFGKELLEAKIKDAKISFLSCNAKLKKVQEFIIKEINGIKIGITAVTPQVESLKQAIIIDDPQTRIKETINKLKSQKVDLIVVLSHLGEDKDTELIKNVKGIDFLISGHLIKGSDKFTKIDDTVLLRPVWQARKLGKLEIDFKHKKINNFSVDWLPLGVDVPDDKDVKSLLPVCFSDYDCVKPNFIGICHNPSALDANCTFQEIKKLSLLVIKPKNCRTCYTNSALNNIRGALPNIEANFLDPEDGVAKKLIEKLNITLLPAYILTDEVEKDTGFTHLQKVIEKKDNYYIFKPYYTGVSYFVGRPFQKNKLDLFVLLNDRQTLSALEVMKALQEKMAKKINLSIHFLIIEDIEKGFLSPGGIAEIEEAKRSVCVMKYYPQMSWDYLICRAKDIQSTWWDRCLVNRQIDLNKIKTCAQSVEVDNLLRQNIQLTQELQVSDTPILLIDNQEVLGLTAKTTVEELVGLIEGVAQ